MRKRLFDLRDRVLVLLLNPIAVRELQAAFRRRRFLVALTVCLCLVSVALIIGLAMLGEEVAAEANPARLGRALFGTFTKIQVFIILLLFPAFSCTAITDERANRSYDLLVVTRLPIATNASKRPPSTMRPTSVWK